MIKNYKFFLIIWVAIGVLFGGYFFIEPLIVKNEVLSFYGAHYIPARYEEVDLKLGKKILLLTIVGVILIGGLGLLSASTAKK